MTAVQTGWGSGDAVPGARTSTAGGALVTRDGQLGVQYHARVPVGAKKGYLVVTTQVGGSAASGKKFKVT